MGQRTKLWYEQIYAITVTFLAFFFLARILTGCVTPRAYALSPMYVRQGHGTVVTYTNAQCQHLLVMQEVWGGMGAASSFAGGAGGVMSAFPNVDTNTRYVIGGISLTTGVAGALFTFLNSSDASMFNQFCTTSTTQ